MHILFLGTGTSHGVPPIDCMRSGFSRCPKDVCRLSATDPKHRRTRCSILVGEKSKHILIDISPDFRSQILREQVQSLDAVLVTHCHADHINGLPDIRSFSRRDEPPLPVFGSEETLTEIQRNFSYAFDPKTFVGGGIPRLQLNHVHEGFDLFGIPITPIPVEHGNLQGCFGYRIGDCAYIPDIKHLPQTSVALLENLDCLILNCLRVNHEHATHLILSQSIDLACRLQPRRCYFTHLSHDVHYAIDGKNLAPFMSFAYDGLRITL